MGVVAKSRAVFLSLLLAASAVVFDTVTTHRQAQATGCDAFVLYSYDLKGVTARHSQCLMNGDNFSPPPVFLQPILLGVMTGPGSIAVAQISRFTHNSINDSIQLTFAEEYPEGAWTYHADGTIAGGTFLFSIAVHKSCPAMVNFTYSINGPIFSYCAPPGSSLSLGQSQGHPPYLLDIFVTSPKSTCTVKALIEDFFWGSPPNLVTLSVSNLRNINVTTATTVKNGLFWIQFNSTRNVLQGKFVKQYSTTGPC
jgi:hypothetical protein